MGGERLFPGQANPVSSDTIAPDNRSLGQIFQCSQAGRRVVGGGFWVQADVYPERWQLWLKSSPGAPLVDVALAALSPSGTGWRYFYLAELATNPYGPLTAAVDYVVNTWTPNGPGNYVYTSGGFAYPFGQTPLSTGACIFRNGGASTLIPNDETFTGGRFYVDVVLDAGPQVLVQGPSRAAQRASRW